MKTIFTHSDFERVPQYGDTVTKVQEYAYTYMPDELELFPAQITVDNVEYKLTRTDIDYPCTPYAQYTNVRYPNKVYELI